MVNAKVVQFRRGRRNYTPRHFLIEVVGIDSRDKAAKLIGKFIEWKAPGKQNKVLRGQITAAHGNKGLVRAVFEVGLPGQAIGEACELVEK